MDGLLALAGGVDQCSDKGEVVECMCQAGDGHVGGEDVLCAEGGYDTNDDGQ